MPSKIITICYVLNLTQCLTQEYNIKEATGIVRLSEDDPEKVTYLRIKTFLPLNEDIESEIKPFETGDIILLKGKFIACPENYYLVYIYFIFFSIKNKYFF